MSKENLIQLMSPALREQTEEVIRGLVFTKNFRSATAEEWYVFLPGFKDPATQGAAGKVIVHYDLQGNKEIFINTTVIFDDPKLYEPSLQPLVYAVVEELVNRLVGYANTMLSVHAGENSYQAEYVD
ncbi:hypothetical protein [Brevibacillus dissolubilis]|uniref:hypothetical protein n=1 Tax=Brevibacillus dissolubilis TaxID=1844116 RepID=UPI001117624A|nr:hypothetical protein [Brevibacillus dissolubilis]